VFAVYITQAAESDIEAAVDYLLSQDADAAAASLWQEFEDAFATLKNLPLRGHVPPELEGYPDKHIREIHSNVYRLIYRIIGHDVYILFVAHGRRDIQKTLIDRVLRFGM
jgi:toxin ParE1/3/4